MIDDHDNEQRCYGDSTILEPIVEQQDDEVNSRFLPSLPLTSISV